MKIRLRRDDKKFCQQTTLRFIITEHNGNHTAYLDLKLVYRQRNIDTVVHRKPTTTTTTIIIIIIAITITVITTSTITTIIITISTITILLLLLLQLHYYYYYYYLLYIGYSLVCPQTNHVPRGYTVAATLLFYCQYVVRCVSPSFVRWF